MSRLKDRLDEDSWQRRFLSDKWTHYGGLGLPGCWPVQGFLPNTLFDVYESKNKRRYLSKYSCLETIFIQN